MDDKGAQIVANAPKKV